MNTTSRSGRIYSLKSLCHVGRNLTSCHPDGTAVPRRVAGIQTNPPSSRALKSYSLHKYKETQHRPHTVYKAKGHDTSVSIVPTPYLSLRHLPPQPINQQMPRRQPAGGVPCLPLLVRHHGLPSSQPAQNAPRMRAHPSALPCTCAFPPPAFLSGSVAFALLRQCGSLCPSSGLPRSAAARPAWRLPSVGCCS